MAKSPKPSKESVSIQEVADSDVLYKHTATFGPSPQKDAATHALSSAPAIRTRRGPAKIKLSTPADVLHEQANIYRDVKHGRMDAGTGKSLTWMLSELRKTLETTVLMERLDLMERQMALGVQPVPEHADSPEEEAAMDAFVADAMTAEEPMRTYTPEQLAEMTRQD